MNQSQTTQASDVTDPEAFVRNNRDLLIRVIRHGDDPFTRGLAIAALVEYGPDPSLDQVIADLKRMEGSQ